MTRASRARCRLPRLPLAACGGRAGAVDLQSFDTVERGRYLAIAADCAACHTKPGGKPFAGGVALADAVRHARRPEHHA